MLSRAEKEKMVQDLKANLDKSQGVFLTNLIGLKSTDAVTVRKLIREAGGKLVINRNTLFERAAKGTSLEGMLKNLKGPQALAFAFKDAAAVAKKLTEISKDFALMQIKAGALQGKILSAAQVKQLASLPSRNQMLSTVLATFNAPVSAFVRTLHAIKEKKEIKV
ncbi:MAG: 50S ribosomal protein L10 [Pseudomonadota bacterium]